MTTSTTSAIYINVIEDVVAKVREEFLPENGPGENVLQELQSRWELKMMQTGAVLPQHERSVMPRPALGAGVMPVHDLNVPYEGNEEYETPTAEMLFPPTPMQTPIQTPMPGTADSSMYNIPTGLSDYPTPNSNEVSGSPNVDIKPGRPNPYMLPPSPWMNQRPSAGVDVNVAYVEQREEADMRSSQQAMQDFLTGPSGKRKRDDIPQQYQAGGYIPQQDGAGDAPPMVFDLEIIQSKGSGREVILNSTNRKVSFDLQKGSSSKIPQFDGPIPDPYDDILSTPNIYNYQGVVNEDYNVVNTPAPDMQAGTPSPAALNDIGNDDDDDDEPPLNENDDDDLDEIDEGEELSTTHLVLAQFDKVTRTKSRWKCTLKDGIMRINNKDILFNKASGEFNF